MLFQRLGGLQVQIEESRAALLQLGVDAFLFDVLRHRLQDVNALHVFSVLHGNDRIVEAARQAGVPVVLSTVLHPPFTNLDRVRAALADRIVGRLTGWSIKTTYAQTMRAMSGANHIIALGESERLMLVDGYRQPSSKVSVVPNGVSARFFSADRALFDERIASRGANAVCIASIGQRKNQLTAAKAFSGLPAQLHLFGPCNSADRAYLDRVLAVSPDAVRFHGPLSYDDPLLPSAYAAATLSILVSESEVMPISVLESLAAGTPVVMGRNHSLGIDPVPGILEMVPHDDVGAIRAACERILLRPPLRDVVRGVVRSFDWASVARSLHAIYQRVAASGSCA